MYETAKVSTCLPPPPTQAYSTNMFTIRKSHSSLLNLSWFFDKYIVGLPDKHTKLTLETKILLPLLSGFELVTFRPRVQRSYRQAIPTLIRYLFHPRVTAVARKRPRSFCQKCRWQVTPIYAYTPDPTKGDRTDYAAVQA